MANTYIRNWFSDMWGIFCHELKTIFNDGGFLIIFFVAGFGYPILYNFIYSKGILEDTPIAVVDESDCQASRRYIREVDATRELSVAYKCPTMDEAIELMKNRLVNGIIYFPSDFGDVLASGRTAKLSIYADMSSFLYYKNLLMGSEFVMLDEIGRVQVDKAIDYEENLPYNRTFSYNIFLISAILMLIIQQVMFYGSTMIAGTAREENRSFATLPDHLHAHGIGRVALGRGAVYWLLFMGVGIYITTIVPAICGFPQRGSYWDILVLLAFFVTDCVFFCFTWSTFIKRRETVFVLLLFMSPICLFLTGFSWPDCAIPGFWKAFSYIFPSTFGCKGFINLNTAGGSLLTVQPQITALALQSICYYVLSCISLYVENKVTKNSLASRP